MTDEPRSTTPNELRTPNISTEKAAMPRVLTFSCDNHVFGPLYGAPYADTERTCETCGIKATRVYWRAQEEES